MRQFLCTLYGTPFGPGAEADLASSTTSLISPLLDRGRLVGPVDAGKVDALGSPEKCSSWCRLPGSWCVPPISPWWAPTWTSFVHTWKEEPHLLLFLIAPALQDVIYPSQDCQPTFDLVSKFLQSFLLIIFCPLQAPLSSHFSFTSSRISLSHLPISQGSSSCEPFLQNSLYFPWICQRGWTLNLPCRNLSKQMVQVSPGCLIVGLLIYCGPPDFALLNWSLCLPYFFHWVTAVDEVNSWWMNILLNQF